jgi:hypothetical protein
MDHLEDVERRIILKWTEKWGVRVWIKRAQNTVINTASKKWLGIY